MSKATKSYKIRIATSPQNPPKPPFRPSLSQLRADEARELLSPGLAVAKLAPEARATVGEEAARSPISGSVALETAKAKCLGWLT